MSEIRIVTNNVPRDVIEAFELTAEEQKEFDYLDWSKLEAGEDSAQFFRYKGQLYDLGEFLTTRGMDSEFSAWDGYQSDSFFSGLLIRYASEDGRPDFERVIIARYETQT